MFLCTRFTGGCSFVRQRCLATINTSVRLTGVRTPWYMTSKCSTQEKTFSDGPPLKKPKRAVPAYFRFIMHLRSTNEEFAKKPINQMNEIASSAWKKLPDNEKQHFLMRADDERKAYREQLQLYKQELEARGMEEPANVNMMPQRVTPKLRFASCLKYLGVPKRVPLNGAALFFQEKFHEISAEIGTPSAEAGSSDPSTEQKAAGQTNLLRRARELRHGSVVMKAAVAKWNALSPKERNVYKERQKQILEDYHDQLEEWWASLSAKDRDRVSSAWRRMAAASADNFDENEGVESGEQKKQRRRSNRRSTVLPWRCLSEIIAKDDELRGKVEPDKGT